MIPCLRVEEASWSILGAELLSGRWAKTGTSPAFSFFARSHAPSPPGKGINEQRTTWQLPRQKFQLPTEHHTPAGTTLGLHLLDDPVVGHHLDVNALLVVVDDLPLELLHLHQATVGRDLERM